METRDYVSFSAVAKSRFRPVAKELGFEQLSGLYYARKRIDWFEAFFLQASQWGDHFYVSYGIAVPDLCPVEKPRPLSDCGLFLAERLRNVDETGGFSRQTKDAVSESARRILVQMRKYAFPFFETLNSWNAIAREYLRTNPIEEEKLGEHTSVFGADFRAANYGYFLIKAKRELEAVPWLREAERIMSQPTFVTRTGKTVHVREKYARLQKPDPETAQALADVRATLEQLGAGA